MTSAAHQVRTSDRASPAVALLLDPHRDLAEHAQLIVIGQHAHVVIQHEAHPQAGGQPHLLP
jgi:hypothetical protein